MSKVDCVLMCGGKGTRLRQVTHDEHPKALLKVAGRELIRYALDLLDPSFVDRLIFAVDFHEDHIRRWVDSVTLPYEIAFSRQENPGYADAVRCAWGLSEKDSLLICHTDEIKPGLDLACAVEAHRAAAAPATVVATVAQRLSQHWVVRYDEASMRVERLIPNPARFADDQSARGLVLAGALILDRTCLSSPHQLFSGDYGDLVRPLIDSRSLHVFVSPCEALFNVGTIDELNAARRHFGEVAPAQRAGQLADIRSDT